MNRFEDTQLKVIFRRNQGGELIIILPTEPADKEGEYVRVYTYADGKLFRDRARYEQVCLATEPIHETEEYKDALVAIESKGIDVYVAERAHPRDHALRVSKARRDAL